MPSDRLACTDPGCRFLTPASCKYPPRALQWHRNTVHEGRTYPKRKASEDAARERSSITHTRFLEQPLYDRSAL